MCNSEIPKRNFFDFSKSGISRRELLERTKLSNLGENPFPNQKQDAKKLCVNCRAELLEREILKANVCDQCVKTFSIVGAELDRYSDEKAKANKLKIFAK